MYVLSKGRIKFQGTTAKLKSEGQFMLRISLKSRASRQEIEHVFASSKVNISHRDTSLSELCYVFDCQSNEDRAEVMKVLDQLMDMAQKGNLVVNKLALN